MSRATIRLHGHSAGLNRSLSGFLTLGPELAMVSLKRSAAFVDEACGIAARTMPALRADCLPFFSGLCDIPETDCPPKCVCDIEWHGCPGETVKATIRVANTSGKDAEFTFDATSFDGDGSVNLLVTPAKATVGACKSIVIQVAAQISDKAQAGRRTAEVLIRGIHEQCVRVVLCVEPSAVAHCEIEHGERPYRIRAHRWYDHFQCIEPCDPCDPRDDTDRDTKRGSKG